MKNKQKIITLVFPAGGLYEKVGFQQQSPYYTVSTENVRPGDTIVGRERGGSRPGLGKAFSTSLGGAARFLNTLRFIDDDDDEELKTRIIGSAGGDLFLENDAGNLGAVTTDTTLVSDRRIWTADYQQKLYIADWDEKLVEGTDGVMTAGTNEIQSVLLSISSGTFTLTFTHGGKTLTTTAIRYDAEPYTVQERLEALDNIGASNVAVSGAAGSYVVVFQGALSGRNVSSLTCSGGTVSVVTAGAPGTFSSVSAGGWAGANDDDFVLVVTDCADSRNLKVLVSIGGAPVGGSWKLQMFGVWTPSMAFDAASHRVKTALATIDGIELDDVDVTGDDGGPYTIEFKGQYAGYDISPPIGIADRLSGTAARAVSVRVTQKGGPIGTHQITGVAGVLTVGATGAGTDCTFFVQRAPKKFDPDSETLSIWEASEGKGFVPTGCPLLCRYRDRLVLAGGKDAPHQWYMSRQGDPLDWDYSQEDVGAAASGQVSEASEVGEPITALIPHADECMVIGCRTSIWIMRGDPAQGGHIDNISQEIGIVDNGSWCFTPDGQLVFMSADGVYMLPAGCGAGRPSSISREYIPERLLNLDPTDVTISMAYDIRDRGVHIFVTNNDSSDATHFWLDWEQKGFWPATYQTSHEPTCIHARRDVSSDYSEVMLGGRDGYVRRHQDDLSSDDTTPFSSHVTYGPILLADSTALYYEGFLQELIGQVAKNSGPVCWEFFAAKTVEAAWQALDEDRPKAHGTWACDGLNPKSLPRVRGAAGFLKVSNGAADAEWAVEHISAVIDRAGERLL